MPRHQRARIGVSLGRFFLVLALGLLATGCDGSKGEIKGKVSYKGTNLTGGFVTFLPSQGASFNAKIGEDGSYQIAKVTPGTMRVGVVSTASQQPPSGMMMRMLSRARKSGKFSQEEFNKLPPQFRGSVKDPAQLMNEVKIPNQYNNPEKSGLEYTVTGGPQEFNIDLK